MVWESKIWFCFIFAIIIGNCIVKSEDIIKDAEEGANITLECRFSPQSTTETLSYYWIRQTKNSHDNVAIGDTPFDPNYDPNFHVHDGIYDLRIHNASYDRDNGRFECKVKAGGSGQDLHVQRYSLTILSEPQPPQIAPGSQVIATESKKQDLTCSSVGGSPDPEIQWFRKGYQYPLVTSLKHGGSRDQPTTATLTITPTKEDDGTVYECRVRNKALEVGKTLTASLKLNVQFSPRITMKPENPLRVERDSQATLECSVDSKPKVSVVKWKRNGRIIASGYNHTIHRVSIQDAGQYTCTADNGIGTAGEGNIDLDVLYAPIVTLSAKTKEAEEGDSVNIRCNVSANPSPITIEWLKDGKPDFRQEGEMLHLSHVTAEHSGTYVCRAVNIINPYGQGTRRSDRSEHVGNISIALLVRHRPGRAIISPSRPVVIEGGKVTLSCAATPPGWPAPQYKWLKIDANGESKIIMTGTQMTLSNVNLQDEATYNCQATNELGLGEMASVDLEVHQPPIFKNRLKPLETKRAGVSRYSVFCVATGKPTPIVKWLKDNEELTADANMFEVKTNSSVVSNGAIMVQSILRFNGKARPNGNELLSSDRGVYTCKFENEESSKESTMHLKIEHEPIIIHQYNKVAFDLSETAEVVCRVLAYPKPEFKWHFGNNISPIHSSSSDGHYVINTSPEDNDNYRSVLRVSRITNEDYGEYTCQVANSFGKIETKIRLQPKGPPEPPTKLAVIHTGSNYVTLLWEPGFNGGSHNTKYFASYKKVPGEDDTEIRGCDMPSKDAQWEDFDCHQRIPCNVSNLEQHQTYRFRVTPMNTKSRGNASDSIRSMTKVGRIPIPQRVAYDKSSNMLYINVPATCLPLVAVIETISNERQPVTAWQVIDTIPLEVSGIAATSAKKSLDQMMSRSFPNPIQDEPIGMDEYSPNIRVKLCLKRHLDHCGEFVEAEFGYGDTLREASALTTSTLIAIIGTAALVLISAGLGLVFCKCRRGQHGKKAQQVKDLEMDSVRPTILTANGNGQELNSPLFQNQAPPPYYGPGLDNQALDLQLALDDQKSVYAATQNGYGHFAEPRNEWNYLDPGYSAPVPGNGSVDSHDSLWHLKMNKSQVYDKYSGNDDYAPFPQTQDPYAQIHKPKNHLDIQTVYHTQGLPDPFIELLDEDKPPPPQQHMSLAYEESLESGYSTPNSRSRRVIREIIV